MKVITKAVWQMTPDGFELLEEESHDYDGPVAECKKDSKMPAAPDPYRVAGAQTQLNQDTAAYNAALNRTNTYSPLGSQTWTMTGRDPVTGAPMYDQNIALSPEQQRLYEQQTGQQYDIGQLGDALIGQARSAYGGPINTSGLPGLRSGVNMGELPGLPGAGDLEGFRNQQTNALYDRNTAYLDRQYGQDEDALRTRLANQGVTEGSEAYRNAYDDFSRGKEMAYRQARNESIAGGGSEAERMFGIGSQTRGQLYGEQLSDVNTGNAARSQGMAELFALRNQPLNELSAVLGMGGASMPQFGGTGATPGAAPADITGAMQNQYQSQVDAASARNASRNQTYSSIASMIPLALMLGISDKRLKDDHGVVGETKDDIPLHLFSYKGSDDKHVGVMAQEAQKKRPDAVSTLPGGIKRVNYFALA
jgi:hypothetical protein